VNVVDVKSKNVSVGVVSTNNDFCPMCTYDPCECGWSDDELSDEERTADLVQVPESELDGDGGTCPVASVTDFGSSIYDCISDFSGYPRERSYGQHNPNLVGTINAFNVGDLVRWFPVSGVLDVKKVWVVKAVLNPQYLDSGWYDYEITDGLETQYVTKFELFSLSETS